MIRYSTMASKAKETPILTGKAADRFAAEVRENQDKPVSKESYARAKSAYERIRENSKL